MLHVSQRGISPRDECASCPWSIGVQAKLGTELQWPPPQKYFLCRVETTSFYKPVDAPTQLLRPPLTPAQKSEQGAELFFL